MKNNLLFVLTLLFTGSINAQSPRMLLIEDFAHASSAASYLSAPGLHDLLEANTRQLVCIQYHPSFPGTDPMYSANPLEMQTRSSFYTISSLPAIVMDGTIFTGQPDNLQQSLIDSRKGQTSPFEIQMEHQLSSNKDSIFVTMIVKSTQAYSGNIKAFLAVTERNIYFPSPPGSTNQKKFEHVMKKMLPDDSGTALQTTWVTNDSIVISQSWPLTGVYNTSQLAVVGWVQEMNTKEVLQAGYGRTHIALDIGVVKAEFNDVLCPGNFVPQVQVKNSGTDVLTSCTVGLRINGGGLINHPWNGTIASDSSAIIKLDTVLGLPGNYVMATAATIPNFGVDEDAENDSNYFSYTVINPPLAPQFMEGFEGQVPPPNWVFSNPDNDLAWAWSGVGAYLTSLGSVSLSMFEGTRNRLDELYLPALDFSSISMQSGVVLRFDYAYTFLADSAANRYDTLSILASLDCGDSWITLWQKGGNDLATAPGVNYSFGPAFNQWQSDTVSLISFVPQQLVLIKLSAKSGRGNNLFLDNIGVDITTGISGLHEQGLFQLTPIPTSGPITIKKLTSLSQDLSIKVADISGKVVFERELQKVGENIAIDLSFLQNGMYMVTLGSGSAFQVIKLVVHHE